ncbi:MAG TPA: hypothetical protein VIR31_04930 [Nitrososphaeraceae archaeon]
MQIRDHYPKRELCYGIPVGKLFIELFLRQGKVISNMGQFSRNYKQLIVIVIATGMLISSFCYAGQFAKGTTNNVARAKVPIFRDGNIGHGSSGTNNIGNNDHGVNDGQTVGNNNQGFTSNSVVAGDGNSGVLFNSKVVGDKNVGTGINSNAMGSDNQGTIINGNAVGSKNTGTFVGVNVIGNNHNISGPPPEGP